MSSKKNAFWGIAFLLGAAAILMSRLGYLEGIGFWSILFNVCLIAMLIRGIIGLKLGTILFSIALLIVVNDRLLHMKGIGFWPVMLNACLITILIKGIVRLKIGTILLSLAFLAIINDELLHLEAITPWPVLGAALLGTIGVKMLFPKLGGYHGGHIVRIGDSHSVDWNNGVRVFDQDGESISYESVFGQSVKYLSGVVEQVRIENAFASTQVYFDNARLSGGSAYVNIDNAFGSVVLYVPMSWGVDLNTDNVFSSSVHKGKSYPDGENVIHVRGEVAFGKVEVISV